jgi:hypothetical protein
MPSAGRNARLRISVSSRATEQTFATVAFKYSIRQTGRERVVFNHAVIPNAKAFLLKELLNQGVTFQRNRGLFLKRQFVDFQTDNAFVDRNDSRILQDGQWHSVEDALAILILALVLHEKGLGELP